MFTELWEAVDFKKGKDMCGFSFWERTQWWLYEEWVGDGEAGSSLTGEEPPESRWEMLRAGAQVEAAGMCTKGKMGSMRRGETEW